MTTLAKWVQFLESFIIQTFCSTTSYQFSAGTQCCLSQSRM